MQPKTPYLVSPRQPLRVRLTRDVRTTETGVVLPAGHIGRVVETSPIRGMAVDFGVANHVQWIPPQVDYIEFVGD
jgi:hypothetical protein